MPDFEFEFNQQDKDLVLNQTDGTFGETDYIRLTIYPTEAINNIVDLPDDTKGIDGKAIFFSTLSVSTININISPFKENNLFTEKSIGDSENDFKIYRNETTNDIYIKPNEIFNKFELPQGDYKIQIDFLNQLKDLSNQGEHYQFIIKQISTSRKEVRLKLLDGNLLNNSIDISNIKTEFNGTGPEDEFNQDGTPNSDYKYQFKHVLNIGTGDHNPIMNYQFDAVTDGKNNQSIILKLYEPLPTNVRNLSMVTIEREVLTTQIQNIFYFSDVPDIFFGDGLIPQPQEDWINPDGNDLGFQNLDELAISSSIGDIELNSLISSSEYGYPNLNTDFNEFANHTFFGSAKKKLQNFNTKVETIQGHYSDLSSSLSMGGVAIGGDEHQVIEKRKNLFQKIENEFKTFTPYERFLYFDGQNESTASAPSLKNYAQSTPVGPTHDGIELNQYDGFNVVYQRTNDTASISKAGITTGSQQWIGITEDLYKVQNKPFFNYSSSIYLSFVMKGDETIDYASGGTKELQWDQFGMTTTGNGLGVPLPKSSQFRERLLQPSITGSEYRRFIYHTSMSYWIPNQGIDFADIPTTNGDGHLLDDNFVTILSDNKTGSYQVKDSTGKYPTTVVTQSGVPFFGSCMSSGELFRLYFRGDLGGITSSFMADVRLTLKNPSDVYPFDNVFKTTSNEWTTWYNNALTQAENFDTDNIHSFENNLPTYIQDSSDYNEMKDFLALQGEQYDLIRNHIDSMGTIHKRGYKKTNSPPDNTLPMLLSNMGWKGINPFEGNLTETLGSYLNGVTSIDDIKNNTWRKTLNNLLYIYKSKGTKNSVRALLNTYGYPPDVLNFEEFGGTIESANHSSDNPLNNDNEPEDTTRGNIDTDLNLSTGSLSFTTKKIKLYNYRIGGNNSKVIATEHYRNNAPINTIEFVYKHVKSTKDQQIVTKAAHATLDTELFDLRLVPSSTGDSSSFQFRLNNSNSGSLEIANNAVSMSTNFLDMHDGQLWNVMLQRMKSSISGSGTNEYRLHTALQDGSSIKTYGYVTMSVSGGLTNTYHTGGDVMTGSIHGRGYFANQNWPNTGSFAAASSVGNLNFGGRFNPEVASTNPEMTGSLAEIRGWSTALSASKFRQHTLNKFSIVGNSILSHCKELVYHYKLNENYGEQSDAISGSGEVHSISSSTQNMQIVDSAHEFGHYSLTKPAHLFLSSSVYGFDSIDIVQTNLKDNLSLQNDNSIVINPNNHMVGNLNPNQNAVLSLTDKSNGKPKFNTSPKLELYRSPQNFVNDFIVGKIGGFNLETKYASPINYFSQSYNELDTFRNDFFDCYDIKADANKFIRSHESMFNHSLNEGVKQVVPARSTFSDKNSNFGVEIKPTILEKQKYEHHSHTVETNPNTGIGTIDTNIIKLSDELGDKQLLTIYDSIKEGTAQSAPSSSGALELPISKSISATPTTSGSTLELPKIGSILPTPSLNESSLPTSKDGTIDYTSIANKSYSDLNTNWGTSLTDIQFINFAAGTSSRGDYNVGHIDDRFVFHTIGDNEIYSASNSADFTNFRNFYNQLQIDNGPAGNINYFNLHSPSLVPSMAAHNGTKDKVSVGRMMGKTRFMREVSDFDGIDGNHQLILPPNHVTKFSYPFKERMIEGTQNTNPGQLNVQHEDYSTASFYRVKVTGGENQIYVKGTSNPTKGSDDKIIY